MNFGGGKPKMIFFAMNRISRGADLLNSVEPIEALQRQEGRLVDPFGREITYVRISVTDRCNLRCTYCMAEKMVFLPRQQVLTLEEIATIAEAFCALGVKKVRLTGGEPLVRQGVMTLVERLGALNGLDELVMTTNGLLLPDYASQLRDNGIKRLNISIDSLRAERYREISRTGELDQALRGIEAARRAGFDRIKLNAVVQAGVNDDEVVDLTRFALDGDMDISFIEEMPLGSIDSHDRTATQMLSGNIRNALSGHYDLVASTETTGGPSRYYRVKGKTGKVGFISPMSDNFCSSCNRVRLTVEGKLLLCLGNEHAVDLKKVVRANPGDTDTLKVAIQRAIERKPEKHHFDPDKVDIVRFMNMTGG